MTATFHEQVDFVIASLEQADTPEAEVAARSAGARLHNEPNTALLGILRAGGNTTGFDDAAYRLDTALEPDTPTEITI